MKNLFKYRFISTIIFVLISFYSFSQNIGSKNTTVEVLGGFKSDSSLIFPIYDTTHAKKIAGNHIYVSGVDYVYNGVKWIQLGSGNGITTLQSAFNADSIHGLKVRGNNFIIQAGNSTDSSGIVFNGAGPRMYYINGSAGAIGAGLGPNGFYFTNSSSTYFLPITFPGDSSVYMANADGHGYWLPKSAFVSSGSLNTIYTADDALTSDRIVDLAGHNLGFSTSGYSSLLHLGSDGTFGIGDINGDQNGTGVIGNDATQELDLRSSVLFASTLSDGTGLNRMVTSNNGVLSVTTIPTGATPAGNYGNLQLNRNGIFSTPASDSLSFNSALLNIKGNIAANGYNIGSTSIIGQSSGNLYYTTLGGSHIWNNAAGTVQNMVLGNTGALTVAGTGTFGSTLAALTVNINGATNPYLNYGGSAGLTRTGAATLAVGNGTAGNAAGTLLAANVSLIGSNPLYLSGLSAGTGGTDSILTINAGVVKKIAGNYYSSGSTYSAGTGLTLTGSTFSVNTSQNISTLSNLTSNGLIKTSGGTGALSIATAGTDYISPTDGSYVKTVVLNTPNVLYTTPINFTTATNTATGSLALIPQSANQIFASPNGSSGTPIFRQIVNADITNATIDVTTKSNATGTPSSTTALFGDNTWKTVSGGTSFDTTQLFGKASTGRTIYQQSNFTSSPFTATGSPTVSIVNNGIQISGGANDHNQYLTYNLPNNDERNNYEILFQATTLGNGIGISGRSINTLSPQSVDFNVNTTNNTIIVRDYAGTTLATYIIGFTIAANDFLGLTFTHRGNICNATITDYTKSYKGDTAYTCPAQYAPNSNNFTIFNYGGTNVIKSARIVSYSFNKPYVEYMGDSKVQAFNVGGRWIDYAGVGDYNEFSGSGDYTMQYLADTAYRNLLPFPAYTVLFDIGRNDSAFSIAPATWRANDAALTSYYQRHGCIVIHARPAIEGASPGLGALTTIDNYITTTYPTSNYNPNTNIVTGSDIQADSIHGNSNAQPKYAANLRTSGLIPIRTELNSIPTLPASNNATLYTAGNGLIANQNKFSLDSSFRASYINGLNIADASSTSSETTITLSRTGTFVAPSSPAITASISNTGYAPASGLTNIGLDIKVNRADNYNAAIRVDSGNILIKPAALGVTNTGARLDAYTNTSNGIAITNTDATIVAPYRAYNSAGQQMVFGKNGASQTTFGIYGPSDGFGRNVGTGNFDIGTDVGDINFVTGTGSTVQMKLKNGGNVGINTSSPNSFLNVNGSLATAIVSKTGAYTATINDYSILANGTFTLTLPTPVGIAGRIYIVKNTGTGTITIGTAAGNIDGVSTKPISTQNSGFQFQSDGANWYIIGSF